MLFSQSCFDGRYRNTWQRKGTGYAHTTSYLSKVFYWIHLVVLLDVTGFFCNKKRESLHAHSICDATCTSENKWDVSDIFIRSIRFLEIVLVRLRNEKPDVSHFFYPIHPICSYSKFVLIRVLTHASCCSTGCCIPCTGTSCCSTG